MLIKRAVKFVRWNSSCSKRYVRGQPRVTSFDEKEMCRIDGVVKGIVRQRETVHGSQARNICINEPEGITL